MSILLETVLGDIVVDLNVEVEPTLSKNVLKLAQARYFTQQLVYKINDAAYFGDPTGTGSGGTSIYGLLDACSSQTDYEASSHRFLRSQGTRLTAQQLNEPGHVAMVHVNGVQDTLGSQFIITLGGCFNDDRYDPKEGYFSIGQVVEDGQNVLEQMKKAICDPQGRPYADIRVRRCLVVADPFPDPPGLDRLLKERGVVMDTSNDRALFSPSPERPDEERVAKRVSVDEIDPEEDTLENLQKREEESRKREDKGRAVVLEMLGDLPDADIRAPENVLFICKLNPITEDEDLELIFSRFDPQVKVEIIRDHATGNSLQYAFAEFRDKAAGAEAYFKMNNALVDDRRIKVDFSQSVAKIWDRYNRRMRMPSVGRDGSFSGNGGPLKRPQGRHRHANPRRETHPDHKDNQWRRDRQSHDNDRRSHREDRRNHDNRRRYEERGRSCEHNNRRREHHGRKRDAYDDRYRDHDARHESHDRYRDDDGRRDEFGREYRRREDATYKGNWRGRRSRRENDSDASSRLSRDDNHSSKKHHKKHSKKRKKHHKHDRHSREEKRSRCHERSQSQS